MGRPRTSLDLRQLSYGNLLWLGDRPASEPTRPVNDIFNHPIMVWAFDLVDQSADVLIVSEPSYSSRGC